MLNSEDEVELFVRTVFKEDIERAEYLKKLKGRRENILYNLNKLELALEKKDYASAYMFSQNISQFIGEDECSDDYNLQAVELDILQFSACIMCVLVKLYSEAQEMMLKLVQKCENPVFCYIFALIHLYQLNFKEALIYMDKGVAALNIYKKNKILWPGTDILVTDIGVTELKAKYLLYLYIMSTMKDVKCSKALSADPDNILFQSVLCANQYYDVKVNKKNLGKFLKTNIYGLVRPCVDNLIALDLSNMPSEYGSVSNVVKFRINEYFSQQFGEDNETQQTKKMKHKYTQRSVKLKHAKIQVDGKPKLVFRATQTTQCGANSKEYLENLQQDLEESQLKLKTSEINNENLKIKIAELEEKLEASRRGFLNHQQQWLSQDEQNRLNMTKLQAQNEVLREKLKTNECQVLESNKKLSACIELLFKECKSSYVKEIASSCFDLRYEIKTNSVLEIMHDIQQDLTPNTIPSAEETQLSITEWTNLLSKCIKRQAQIKSNYKKIQTIFAENRFYDLYDLPDLPSFPPEPQTLMDDYFPTVVVSLIECQEKLTSNKYMKDKFTQTNKWKSVVQEQVQIQELCSAAQGSAKACDFESGRTHVPQDTLECNRYNYTKSFEQKQKVFERKQFSHASILTCSEVESNYKTAAQVTNRTNPLIGMSLNSSSMHHHAGDPGINMSKNINETNSGVDDGVISRLQETCSYTGNRNSSHSSVKSSFEKESRSVVDTVHAEAYVDDLSALNTNSALSSSDANIETKRYKKLCALIQSKIPSKTDSQIARAVSIFREQNNGKLSGMTVHNIVSNIRKILSSQSATEDQQNKDSEGDCNKTSCCICFEDLNLLPMTILKCKHKYHTWCIQQWLSTSSICAICRIHVTMDEDFSSQKA